MPNQDGVELSWIFDVIRRKWLIIIACTILTTVIAFAIISLSTPVYEATATLLIQPAQDARSTEYNLLVAGERLALTYSQMIKSQPVMQRVILQEDLLISPNKLASKMDAVPVPDTQLMRLTVTDTSAEQAAYLANTVAQAFTSFIQEMNSERFSSSLGTMQEKLDELDAAIQETQSSMNDYRASKIESEADLTNHESNLVEYRNEYQSLQEDYQALKLTVSQLKENVNVIEPAHAVESDSGSFNTATVTLFLTNEDLAPTYLRILTGKPVLEETIALLGLSENPEELANWITVESVPGTHLIRLNVKDVSADQAILVADTMAWVFIDQIQKLMIEPYADNLTSLETQLNELSDLIDRTQLEIERLTLENIQSETELERLGNTLVENRNDYRTLQQDYEQLRVSASDASETVFVSESAHVPNNPIQRGRLFLIVGAAIGMVTGLGLAFLLEYFDDTIKTAQDITNSLGLDALGSIPRVIDGDNELVVVEQPRSPIADSFRMLSTNLRFYSLDKSIRILLVTSPAPEAGKSVIVANLAAAIAMSGSKVLVVDADLRRPRQHIIFGLRSGEGLTGSLLDGEGNERLQTTEVENLSVLTSGQKLPPNPTELLGSQSMAKLLEKLAADVDMILLDSPPVLSIADTAALTSWVDGVLFVVESGVTRPGDAKQALSNLHQVGANIIGAVLNAVPDRLGPYHYYYQDLATSTPAEEKRQQTRFGKIMPSALGWLQSKNGLSNFFERFQNKDIFPTIRSWLKNRR
jgi:succinoglycan biosynthesis transport protein ExoP